MKFVYENFSRKIFPGFYESTLYNSDMFDYLKCSKGFYFDFKTGEFQKYIVETCDDWVSEMSYQIKDNPIGLEILGYVGIRSPGEYNFRTDRISIEIKVNLFKLKKYCFTDNQEKFDKYLTENWTSYSGFCSFIPNNIPRFKYEYKKQSTSRNRLIQVMVEWYLLQFIDFDEITMSIFELQCERLNDKLVLVKDDNLSEWNYEYSEEKDEYIPTLKIA